jgi:hypothetical protein
MQTLPRTSDLYGTEGSQKTGINSQTSQPIPSRETIPLGHAASASSPHASQFSPYSIIFTLPYLLLRLVESAVAQLAGELVLIRMLGKLRRTLERMNAAPSESASGKRHNSKILYTTRRVYRDLFLC